MGMRRRALPLTLMLIPLLVGALTHEGPRKHSIEITGFEYKPVHLRVQRGDTIVWVNRDAVPHTATATNREWDSGTIGAGASTAVAVTRVGEQDYFCALHPSMKAKITVRRGGDK